MVLPENMEGLPWRGRRRRGGSPQGSLLRFARWSRARRAASGASLCAELARDHGVLRLVGRSQDKLDELAKNLAERFGVGVRTFVADFAQPGAVDALASQVQAANLQVETLMNNAGFGYDAPFFAESSLNANARLCEPTTWRSWSFCHAFAPGMAARGHGGILNVASVAGFVPGPYMSTYYASKAFVQSFSSALHMELRPHGVHVTALCPGLFARRFGTTPTRAAHRLPA